MSRMTPGTAALGFALVTVMCHSQVVSAQGATGSLPVPQAAVAALNRVSGGPHPGFRANHAKGILLTGHFTASRDAASLSKAAHLKAGAPVAVIVRFSDGTGVPELPDADPNASPHGMAIRFSLPDHSSTDIVTISASSFPVAKPEEFVELLNAIADSGSAKSHPTPIETFFKAHPTADAWAHTPRPPPVSFATLEYYGINAFRFTNQAGQQRYGRYQIRPVAGEHALSDAQAKAVSRDYLLEEVPKRLAQGPVEFRLVVQLAAAGDAVNDGSVAWPASRPTVELGTITIDGLAKDQVGEQKRLMFNPLSLTAGIEPSDDPVLLVRPAAYALSFVQRAN